ncbi:MAG: 4-hydroxythreonine-4-phosphate dehydrogenase PdxA [Ignavibacteriales bacterium]
MKKFVFTCGDINGIGPEIVQKSLNKIYSPEQYKFYYLCPADTFERVSEMIQPSFEYKVCDWQQGLTDSSSKVVVINIGKSRPETGKPTRNSGELSYKAVRKSYELTTRGVADAIITAPISKYALSLAGVNFPGHTEMFAEWASTDNYVMMFMSSKMNCALMTIHEPIKKISKLLTEKRIKRTLKVIINSLQADFGIKEPKIAVLGLNPHAGENGRIGSEELNTIIPAISDSEYNDLISGPFVPDAFFASQLFREFDIVVGMYHDQVLIPFKMLNFSSGVNFTAGLPFIRTSPDHGTAFDIAGKNMADESSILEAFYLSERIISNRFKNEPGKS